MCPWSDSARSDPAAAPGAAQQTPASRPDTGGGPEVVGAASPTPVHRPLHESDAVFLLAGLIAGAAAGVALGAALVGLAGMWVGAVVGCVVGLLGAAAVGAASEALRGSRPPYRLRRRKRPEPPA